VKKTIICLEFALMALVWWSVACASLFFGEDTPGQPVYQRPDWPAGLADLLTRGGRVYSSSFGWLGGDEDCFYFSGDTDDFNWFVECWAKLEGVSRTLGLHRGRGQVNGIISKQPIGPFDWKVTVTAHWAEGGRSLGISLDLWIGGEVTPEKLRVPSNMEVRAAGQGEEFKEIEKFIADHEAKRRKPGYQVKDSPLPAK
jgi:hypothetical protein